MKKKLLCITLISLMTLGLTACGGGVIETSDTSDPNANTVTQSTDGSDQTTEEFQDVPKEQQEGTAGSGIPLKDNDEAVMSQVPVCMQELLSQMYGDKFTDSKITVSKIYSADEESSIGMKLGLDEVAFEVTYDIKPAEGADVNELIVPNGTYDEGSGWIIGKTAVGVLEKNGTTYTIKNFGTGW